MKKTCDKKSPYAGTSFEPVKAPHTTPQPKSKSVDAGTGDLRARGGKKK